jgi:phage shock protein A
VSDRFRVIAIISAFNEGDIIAPVIGHLVENGVDVYLLDNHSTDDTVQQAEKWLGRGLLEIETFPATLREDSAAGETFQWGHILERKEELALTLPADWFIHHDADEIRESPWPGLTLRDAVRWVDRLGYNCIDFRLLNFPPVDDGFRRGDDPRSYFTGYEEGAGLDWLQLKCWKAGVAPVSLSASGGHEAQFEGRSVCPIRFLLRHYPIRGQRHGRQKVFRERKGRFLSAELSSGWHRQYNDMVDENHCFLKDPATLLTFDLDQVRLDQMLPDKNAAWMATTLARLRDEREKLKQHGETLERDRDSLRQHAAIVSKDRDSLREHAGTLEKDLASLRQHATTLETDRDSLRQHAANLEKDLASLRQHAATLEAERDSLRQHTTNLKHGLDSLTQHAANLENDRNSLRQHAVNVETDRDALRRQVDDLQKEIEALRTQASHLHTNASVGIRNS